MDFSLLIYILIVVVVCGGVAALINYSPIDGRIKQWGSWLVIAVGVIMILIKLAGIANVA